MQLKQPLSREPKREREREREGEGERGGEGRERKLWIIKQKPSLRCIDKCKLQRNTTHTHYTISYIIGGVASLTPALAG